MILRALFAFTLYAAAAAAPAATGCSDLAGLPINQNVQWSQVWTTLTNESSCTQNCHIGSFPTADLDLSNAMLSIYFLVGQPSSQLPIVNRVEPGMPQASLLWQKVACGLPDVGTSMPPSGGVSLQIQGLIYDWIQQGAYGESPEDPIPRDFMFRDSLESLRR